MFSPAVKPYQTIICSRGEKWYILTGGKTNKYVYLWGPRSDDLSQHFLMNIFRNMVFNCWTMEYFLPFMFTFLQYYYPLFLYCSMTRLSLTSNIYVWDANKAIATTWNWEITLLHSVLQERHLFETYYAEKFALQFQKLFCCLWWLHILVRNNSRFFDTHTSFFVTFRTQFLWNNPNKEDSSHIKISCPCNLTI
jgi:hypothetical protein